MIMVYCIFNLFILLSFEDFGLNNMKIQKASFSLEKKLFDQLMNLETHQLKL